MVPESGTHKLLQANLSRLQLQQSSNMKERKNAIQLTGQATLAMASRTMYKEPSFKQRAAVMDMDGGNEL